MDLSSRIQAFVKLGQFLRQFEPNGAKSDNPLNSLYYDDFNNLISSVRKYNPWFTEENVRFMLGSIAGMLSESTMIEWLSGYITELERTKAEKTVAVIMAGNVPLVGFHDFLSVLVSGNKFLGKLSSDDNVLLPFLAKLLIAIEPRFTEKIDFVQARINKMDAVIATGSNNTSRYFEYYFGKYPHIIRKNRNSAAVLTGAENANDLKKIGNDIFQYYGLGCRNVSKLFVPKNYNFDIFFEAIYDFQGVINNNKYANNYEYNRTVYLMKNDASLLDNNFILLKEDESYISPIGVLFYEYYETIEGLNKRLEKDKEQLQCIVSITDEVRNSVLPGNAQCPALWDYADGIDTMNFLIKL